MRRFALIGLIGLCALAARAAAAPAPSVFRVSVSGAVTAEWDHTGASRLVGNCTTSLRSEGVRVTRFRLRRPTLVRFEAGRIRPVELRGLAGTVTLTGHNTLTESCGGPELHTTDQPCAKTIRAFTNGRTRLTSGGAGRVRVRTPQASLRRAACPREPADVVATPLGPAPGPLRLSTSALVNARFGTISLAASAVRRNDYGDPETGSSTQRVSWKLTFVRVRP